jgi:hypothetical protein
MDWLPIPKGSKRIIEEVENAFSDEPWGVYSERYSRPASSLNEHERGDARRYISEIVSGFDEECSILLFGSGHSYYANEYYKCSNVSQLDAMDIVAESSLGLDPNIGFIQQNILDCRIEKIYDYIFSTHTIEHFTRDQILNNVIPKLCQAARKAVVLLTPYANNWGSEPTHRCRFYDNDELAALSSKYKRIRDNPDEGTVGIEIVYWIEGRAWEYNDRAGI